MNRNEYPQALIELFDIIRPTTLAALLADLDTDARERGTDRAAAYRPALAALTNNVGTLEAHQMIADAKAALLPPDKAPATVTAARHEFEIKQIRDNADRRVRQDAEAIAAMRKQHREALAAATARIAELEEEIERRDDAEEDRIADAIAARLAEN